MKFSSLALTTSLVSIASSAYIPSEPWSTLTPSAPAPSGAIESYSASFGIAVIPIASSSAAPKNKRDVVSQIGDGQVQATTATAQAVSQIGDGQVQATTATAQAVSQIGDGQVQATTATAQAVSQIGDGQVQATTASAKTATGVSQIGDGQPQATTAETATAVSQIHDGQAQQTSAALPGSSSKDVFSAVSCKSEGSLVLTLKDSVLTDAKGRIGSIVANRQFQFDGPPPQAGAIYAAGWSITKEGNLAIGDNDVFYQCLSGTFYNLYDESLGEHCHPIHLEAVKLVDC